MSVWEFLDRNWFSIAMFAWLAYLCWNEERKKEESIMELSEYKCQNSKCSIRWRATYSQNYCSDMCAQACDSTLKSSWTRHNRMAAAKAEENLKLKEEHAPEIVIRRFGVVTKVKATKKIAKQFLRGEGPERPSWNQRVLAKKYANDPSISKCSKCQRYFKNQQAIFGSSARNISDCPACGSTSNYHEELINL